MRWSTSEIVTSDSALVDQAAFVPSWISLMPLVEQFHSYHSQQSLSKEPSWSHARSAGSHQHACHTNAALASVLAMSLPTCMSSRTCSCPKLLITPAGLLALEMPCDSTDAPFSSCTTPEYW